MIEAGLAPEKLASVSEEFASYEEALGYFIRTVNAAGAAAYFSHLAQATLRFETDVREES